MPGGGIILALSGCAGRPAWGRAGGAREGDGAVDEPFVGRLAELAELDRQFALAAAGRGRVVVLAGPAGGGKTALIGRCLPRWDADTALVSGDEAEVSLAGGLLGQLAQTPAAGQSAGQAVDQAADLAAVLNGGRADPLSAGAAVLALLRQRARAGPLVLVVDDAQWGDELSLRALSFAARRLPADPVLCLIATRSDGLARLPPGLRKVAAERGTHLDLAGLDAGEVAALAELAGAGRLPARSAERLREHTGGIPLHVRELLHDLPAELLKMPGTSLPAPRSLQTLVVSRLAVCAPGTEALVVAAAVLGGDCELADAAVLAGLADPLPALQEAIGQRLLTEPSGQAGRRRVTFGHALIRTAVYQDIGVARRAALHRAAAALSSGGASLAHRVAGCAGPDDQLAAALAAQAAGERESGQLPPATEHLLMAARVTGDRVSAEGWLAEAVVLLIDQGDAARARGYTAQIAAMAPSAQRDLLLGRLDLLAGACAPAEQQITHAWAALAADAGTGQPAGPTQVPRTTQAPVRDAAAKAACELAIVLMGQHRLADAASWARRSGDVAASEFTRACSHVVQGGSLAASGQARRARAVLETELAECNGNAARALVHTGLGGVLMVADDLPGAAAHLAAATADQACLPMTHLLEARLLQVDLAYRSGQWDRAAADGDRLIALIDDLDQGWLLGRAHLAAVYAAAGRGQWQAALGHADAAAGQPGAGGIALAGARTAIAVARDDLPAILAAAADAVADPALLRHMEPSRLSFWPAYAAALARTGEYAEADRTLRPYEQRAAGCTRRSALAAASRARGVLHTCRRRRDDALAAFDASLTQLDGLGLPLEEAMTRLERGRLLRHIGQRRAAARDIGAARLLFAGLRAQPFLARCDAELGADPLTAPGPDTGRPPLTARQLLVARAAAAGKSNRQIAGELYISVKTVEFHLGQILARLDLDSRAQIAGALAAREVLPGSDSKTTARSD
jgi:DNA-binding CsgD family transcriptional regulator